MHHHSRNIAPYPPPDVVQRHDSASDPTPSTSSAHPQEPSTTAQPSFLIINLFALRLTLRLISRIPAYPSLNQDMFWLTMFLSPFPATHDLAKLTSRLKRDYLATYPKIVGRMKRQPKYPAVFMQMNPATWERREEVRRRGWTDEERLEMIDFSDAALEWGSVVQLPSSEMGRMVELAEGRRVVSDEELGITD